MRGAGFGSLILVIVLLLSGCVAPGARLSPASAHAGALASLAAPDATATRDAADGSRTFTFAGASHARHPSLGNFVPVDQLYDGAQTVLNRSFDLDGALVGTMDVQLNYDDSRDALRAAVYDADGRLQCRAEGASGSHCEVEVPAGQRGKGYVVVSAQDMEAAGSAFTANVTLRPVGLRDITNADPTTGTDPSIRFRNVDTTGRRGSEMNLGVLADGTIFVEDSLQTMRSKDDGKTWRDVSPPSVALGTCDPMLRADPWSGRVYTAQLNCLLPTQETVLSWTTDEGATWLTNPLTGPMPQQDHEKLALGPSPIPGSPIPALYYAHTSPGAVYDRGTNPSFVSRSLDGGVTFTTTPVTGMTDDISADVVGAIEADRGSTVYLPISECGKDYYGPSKIGVATSNDYGATFRYQRIATSNFSCSTSIDPGVGIDADGKAYLAFIADGAVEYVTSADHGATWSAPQRVSPASQRMASHVDIIAGDAGKIAIAYRATSDSAREPSFAEGWSAWHMYVAFVEDAASAAPRVRVSLVTPPNDPVMRGCVWQYGGDNPCRSLYDFIDVAVGPDGRVYVAYPDACLAPCPTPPDSRAHKGMLAIEEDGPRLFAAKAPWAK